MDFIEHCTEHTMRHRYVHKWKFNVLVVYCRWARRKEQMIYELCTKCRIIEHAHAHICIKRDNSQKSSRNLFVIFNFFSNKNQMWANRRVDQKDAIKIRQMCEIKTIEMKKKQKQEWNIFALFNFKCGNNSVPDLPYNKTFTGTNFSFCAHITSHTVASQSQHFKHCIQKFPL